MMPRMFQSPDVRFVGGTLILIFIVYLWPDLAFKSPYGMHQWRQCDAFSMAVNYQEEGRAVLDPAMHFVHGLAEGKAVGEFTGTYWLNAQIWKVTGRLPWTIRWMHFALWLAGLIALYALGKRWVNPSASAWVAWMVMVSPLMAFYGPNYLVNASALGLVFIGWWFTWRFHERRDKVFWFGGLLAFGLSFLFRPTMAIGLIPLILFVLFRRSHWRMWVLAIFPVVVATLWVFWSQRVNDLVGSVYYCTTIRPIWDAENASEIWSAFQSALLPEWYHHHVRWIFVLMACFWAGKSMIKWSIHQVCKRMFHGEIAWLGWSNVAMLSALFGYVLLWFSNLDVHDYYLIEFQLVVPLFLWWMLIGFQDFTGKGLWQKRLGVGILVLVLSFQTLDARVRTRMKYVAPSGWLSEQLIPAWERDLWGWFHWDYQNRLAPLEKITPHLRSLGIGRESRVISVPDPSPNITLSMMDVHGFTDLYDDDLSGEDRIAHYVEKGASFLVCNDPAWLQELDSSLWLTAPMQSFEHVQIFDLKASEAMRNRE